MVFSNVYIYSFLLLRRYIHLYASLEITMKFNDWLLSQMQKRNLSRNGLFDELTNFSSKRFVSRKLWYEVTGADNAKLPTLQSIVNIEKALNEEYKPHFDFDDFESADKTFVCDFCYEYNEKYVVKRIYVSRSTYRKIGFCFPESYGFFDIPMTICKSCYEDQDCFIRLTISDLISEIKRSLSINNKQLSAILNVDSSTISRSTKATLSEPNSIKQLNVAIVTGLYQLAKSTFQDPLDSVCDISDKMFFKLAKKVDLKDLTDNALAIEVRVTHCELCQTKASSLFKSYASTQLSFSNGFLSPEKHGYFDIECIVCTKCYSHFSAYDSFDYFQMLGALTNLNGNEWINQKIGKETLLALEQEYELEKSSAYGEHLEIKQRYTDKSANIFNLNKVKAYIFKTYYLEFRVAFRGGISYKKREHLSQAFKLLMGRRDTLKKGKLQLHSNIKSFFAKTDLFFSSNQRLIVVYESPKTELRYWSNVLELALNNAVQFVCFFDFDEDTVPLEPLAKMLWFDVSQWPVSFVNIPIKTSGVYSLVPAKKLNRAPISNHLKQQWPWKYLLPSVISGTQKPKAMSDTYKVLILYYEQHVSQYKTIKYLLIFEITTGRLSIKIPQISNEISETEAIHAAIEDWKKEFIFHFPPFVDCNEVLLLFSSKPSSGWLSMADFYADTSSFDSSPEWGVTLKHAFESQFARIYELSDEVRDFNRLCWRYLNNDISAFYRQNLLVDQQEKSAAAILVETSCIANDSTWINDWIKSYDRLQAYKLSHGIWSKSIHQTVVSSGLILTIKDSDILLHQHPEYFVDYCIDVMKPIGVGIIIWNISHICEPDTLQQVRRRVIAIRKSLSHFGIRLFIDHSKGSVLDSEMLLQSQNRNTIRRFSAHWYEYFL
jgi:hypothetical protein